MRSPISTSLDQWFANAFTHVDRERSSFVHTVSPFDITVVRRERSW